MRDNEFKARLRSHSRNMKNSIDSPFDITQKIDEMEMSDMTKKQYHLIGLKTLHIVQQHWQWHLYLPLTAYRVLRMQQVIFRY